VVRGVVVAALLGLLLPASAWAKDVAVVVQLEAPGLAQGRQESRVLSAAAKARRLELSSPSSVGYLGDLSRSQAAFERRLGAAVPAAQVYRRYRVVLNAVAVSLPEASLPRLRSIRGVREVFPATTYVQALDRSLPMIGAPTYWSFPGVQAGAGAKIAVLDDGIDQSHDFFSPAGYAMPPGFPKGQTAHTTAKVIVARSFVPRGVAWPASRLPFDPQLSFHATHVAGIAAGNAGTLGPNGVRLAGVAPGAYLGNYKVLTVPTEEFGLNGNAPEIAAGIEAAVADGMDVINLSLGQPEIEPTRDLVAAAIEGAAAAGVPTVAAAGNEFGRFGLGSVGSPASAASAITVGALTTGRSGAVTVSSFSSAGPAPVSLRFKPELAAPGSDIVSAAPGDDWSFLSGTSMAAPHVSGAVALLRRRHPGWTPAQLKSALVQTAAAAPGTPLRTGGGIANVPAADTPLFFAEPAAVALGVVPPGTTVTRTVRLTDAGGGAGVWQVSGRPGLPPTATVPGDLELRVVATPVADGDDEFFVTLSRDGVVRRTSRSSAAGSRSSAGSATPGWPTPRATSWCWPAGAATACRRRSSSPPSAGSPWSPPRSGRSATWSSTATPD
jgi:subtilisin family serine protease